MKALVWTLVHSLWQGLLAALLAAIIISATRKSPAKLRYNLLGMVLVFFLAGVCFNFFIQWQQQQATGLILGEPGIAGNNNEEDIVAATAAGGVMTNFINWLNSNTGLVLGIWLVFFFFHCLKLFVGFAAVNRLRNYKVHPVTPVWKTKLEELRVSLGIRQSIALLQSELVKVPLALGHFKPVILLPLGWMTNIPPEQVEAILLHELGHIRRKDYLVNFIQNFTEAIFFFNPGIRWVSSLLRQEREACCDDIVVASSPGKRNYVNALVAFQEYSMGHTSYAMAITHKRYYLLNRVKRILTNENQGVTIFEKVALLGGIILFSAFTFVTQEKKMKEREKQPKEAVVQQLPAPVLQQSPIKLPSLPVKKGKRTQQISLRNDTIPVQKDTTKLVAPAKSENKLPTNKDWENAANHARSGMVLQEIIQIKEKIGAKKESIGVKKEQVEKQEGKEKEETLNKIKKERGEVEEIRDKLVQKIEEYKKLKDQEKEKKQTGKENLKESEQEKKPRAMNRVEKMGSTGIYNDKSVLTKITKVAVDTKSIESKLANAKAGITAQQKRIDEPRTADKPKPLKMPDAPKVKNMTATRKFI